MVNTRFFLTSALSVALLLGCGGDRSEPDGVGVVSQAIGPCNETVPTNRFIDGFPAYAQCATTMNSDIYSNNGVDTATTAMGSDWVRTQFSGGYQCTELAHRYLLFKWHVMWLPRGDAGTWCDTMPTAGSGVVQTTTPVHGDLMVFGPGSCGADPTTGHVAVVDVVGAPGTKLSAVQQNVASRSSYAPTCAKCYLHVVANDGAASGAGGAPSSGGSGGMLGSGGASASSTGGVPVGAGGVLPVGAGGQLFAAGGALVTPPAAGGASAMPVVASGGALTTVPSAAGGAVSVAPGGAAAPGYAGAAGSPLAQGEPAATSGTSCSVRRGAAVVPARDSAMLVLATLVGLAGLRGRKPRHRCRSRTPC